MRKQAQKPLADMVLLYHGACNRLSLLLFPRIHQGFCRSVQASGDAVELCCSGGGPCHCYRAPLKEHHNTTLQQGAQAPHALKDKNTETTHGMVQGEENKKNSDLGAS